MIKSKIIGVGSFVPGNNVKNKDLEKIMDTSNEWIIKRTGIESRNWVEGEESTSDIAYIASLKALENANIKATDLDMIIVATITPDFLFPGVGCLLQEKLQAETIPAFDIRQQCTGFIYGMSMANLYIQSGQYKNILLVGAEVQSKALNKTTEGRDITVLFGDGAGAVIVTRKDDSDNSESEIFSSQIHSEGKFAKDLCILAPGTGLGKDWINEKMLNDGLQYPQMNGKKVFVHAIKRMCESVNESLDSNNQKLEDIDLFFFHQANLRINDAIGEKLGIPNIKIFNTIQNLGNTTAATIPISIDMAVKAGVLKKGMKIMLTAFGSGFTWGSTYIKY